MVSAAICLVMKKVFLVWCSLTNGRTLLRSERWKVCAKNGREHAQQKEVGPRSDVAWILCAVPGVSMSKKSVLSACGSFQCCDCFLRQGLPSAGHGPRAGGLEPPNISRSTPQTETVLEGADTW